MSSAPGYPAPPAGSPPPAVGYPAQTNASGVPASPPPIEVFGKYHFLRKIGQGGMAEVFLARLDGAPPDAPAIVIKRLHQELERDAEAVDLFLTEADVTLLLDHPNVVKVWESGEINGRYYMAMEYLQGTDLERLIGHARNRGKPIPVEVCLHVLREILTGLAYVHDFKTPSGRNLGIVHRDITPSNIWIGRDGAIKLGDFGVAKLVGVESWTVAGSLKGKLGYFAPEQIAGEPITQTIDSYSAAIILYELCTGQQCFTGKTELEIMLAIKNADVVKPRKHRADLPGDVQDVILRALHRKPHKRYANAAEFCAAIERLITKVSRPITATELVAYIKALASS